MGNCKSIQSAVRTGSEQGGTSNAAWNYNSIETGETVYNRSVHNIAPNDTNIFGSSLLHLTCQFGGSPNGLKMLIRDGANVNLEDINKRTPLHIACMFNSETSVKILLTEGNAKVNTQDKNGNTPLHLAFIGKTANKQSKLHGVLRHPVLNNCFHLLLHGAKFDIKNNYGYTAMDICNNNGLGGSIGRIMNGFQDVLSMKVFEEYLQRSFRNQGDLSMIFLHLIFPFLLDHDTASLFFMKSKENSCRRNSIHLALEKLDRKSFVHKNLLDAFHGIKFIPPRSPEMLSALHCRSLYT